MPTFWARAARPPRGLLALAASCAAGFPRRASRMPIRHDKGTCPERAARVLAEAIRRVEAAVAVPVDIDALRRALETEQRKGPLTLAALVKVGRRRALDRVARMARKAAG